MRLKFCCSWTCLFVTLGWEQFLASEGWAVCLYLLLRSTRGLRPQILKSWKQGKIRACFTEDYSWEHFIHISLFLYWGCSGSCTSWVGLAFHVLPSPLLSWELLTVLKRQSPTLFCHISPNPHKSSRRVIQEHYLIQPISLPTLAHGTGYFYYFKSI